LQVVHYLRVASHETSIIRIVLARPMLLSMHGYSDNARFTKRAL